MAENREITLFSEPEELIAWAEVYDKQINPSIEDAALLLNYMEGHDYAIGMDAEGTKGRLLVLPLGVEQRKDLSAYRKALYGAPSECSGS